MFVPLLMSLIFKSFEFLKCMIRDRFITSLCIKFIRNMLVSEYIVIQTFWIETSRNLLTSLVLLLRWQHCGVHMWLCVFLVQILLDAGDVICFVFQFWFGLVFWTFIQFVWHFFYSVVFSQTSGYEKFIIVL